MEMIMGYGLEPKLQRLLHRFWMISNWFQGQGGYMDVLS